MPSPNTASPSSPSSPSSLKPHRKKSSPKVAPALLHDKQSDELRSYKLRTEFAQTLNKNKKSKSPSKDKSSRSHSSQNFSNENTGVTSSYNNQESYSDSVYDSGSQGESFNDDEESGNNEESCVISNSGDYDSIVNMPVHIKSEKKVKRISTTTESILTSSIDREEKEKKNIMKRIASGVSLILRALFRTPRAVSPSAKSKKRAMLTIPQTPSRNSTPALLVVNEHQTANEVELEYERLERERSREREKDESSDHMDIRQAWRNNPYANRTTGNSCRDSNSSPSEPGSPMPKSVESNSPERRDHDEQVVLDLNAQRNTQNFLIMGSEE